MKSNAAVFPRPNSGGEKTTRDVNPRENSLLAAVGCVITLIVLAGAISWLSIQGHITGAEKPARKGKIAASSSHKAGITPKLFMSLAGRPDQSDRSEDVLTMIYAKSGAIVDFVRDNQDYKLFLVRDNVTGEVLSIREVGNRFPFLGR